MENCGYFEELISAELDGELSEAEKEALRAHLETCDACRAYREALRAVSGTEADLPAPPADLTGRIMDAVRREAEAKKKPKVIPFRRYLRAGALAAAAALVLWAGFRVAGPKGAAKTASSAPAAAMSMMASDTAPAEAEEPELEYESDAAAPETQARGAEENSLFAAAAAPAAMEDAPEAAMEESMDFSAATASTAADMGSLRIRYALYEGEDGALLLRGEMEEADLRALLTAEKPCPAPDRAPDYTLVLDDDGETWSFWLEDGGVIARRAGTEDAGYTVPADVFREMLGL